MARERRRRAVRDRRTLCGDQRHHSGVVPGRSRARRRCLKPMLGRMTRDNEYADPRLINPVKPPKGHWADIRVGVVGRMSAEQAETLLAAHPDSFEHSGYATETVPFGVPARLRTRRRVSDQLPRDGPRGPGTAASPLALHARAASARLSGRSPCDDRLDTNRPAAHQRTPGADTRR